MEPMTRRRFMTASGTVLTATMAGGVRQVAAQGGAATAGPADPMLIEDLVAANRILVDQRSWTGTGT